jgi:hypothetical protein
MILTKFIYVFMDEAGIWIVWEPVYGNVLWEGLSKSQALKMQRLYTIAALDAESGDHGYR